MGRLSRFMGFKIQQHNICRCLRLEEGSLPRFRELGAEWKARVRRVGWESTRRDGEVDAMDHNMTNVSLRRSFGRVRIQGENKANEAGA